MKKILVVLMAMLTMAVMLAGCGGDSKKAAYPADWEFNQTIIMITHNEEIAQLADRIIHLEDGRVVGGDIHVSEF